MPESQLKEKFIPLAELLRPKSLSEVIGQHHLLSDDGPIGNIATSGKLHSFVLWGPPGVGKTTIARLLAQLTSSNFVQISAAHTNVAELKQIFAHAKEGLEAAIGTILFVDEIHSFNRSRQDIFLPHLENGTIVLIGATTENPSFELNTALLSRLQVYVLNRLSQEELQELFRRAESFFGQKLPLDDYARDYLVEIADGDGRGLLNLVEQIHARKSDAEWNPGALSRLLTQRTASYDKSREWHYNLISALHKSVRGSDPDAALYWLARILDGGENPRYLARRLTRMAIEDVGLADPDAAELCIRCWEVYERLGSPEGELALAQATIYLALAPKSNSVYKGYGKAVKAAQSSGSLTPPMHILNAPTRLMSKLGYGKDYQYDHDVECGVSGQDYFPVEMRRSKFYEPVERGFERTLGKRLKYFESFRSKQSNNRAS